MLWVEVLSRMRINLDKSSILSVGDVENPNLLGSLPTTYLGLPHGQDISPQRFGMLLRRSFGRD